MSETSKGQFELLVGQLVVIIVAAMLITLAVGYFLGNDIGYTKGVNAANLEVPEYCSTDRSGSTINVTCNELSGIDLGGVCNILSSELKNKVKVVVIA